MQSRGGDRKAMAIFNARIARSRFIRLLTAQPMTRLECRSKILTVAGTVLVARGYVEASDIEPAIGALLTIGSVVWSVVDKRGR